MLLITPPVRTFLLLSLLAALAGCTTSYTLLESNDPVDAPRRVSIAFGSCADMDEDTQQTWTAIVDHAPDALVLLGDTPYIDSTDPERQRERYARFAATPGFTDARERMTIYGTWDDHDFGRNDTDGNLDGKENSRAAFIEHYEPLGNETFGNGEEGVYTNFVVDNIEVFLLDTRYFAATEPSAFDADKPTLLGADQWEWLQQGLRASEADFKVLACGMIWNGSVRPGKPDHWATYPHEYDALMDFIGEAQIDGVVLVGGDIHRSRCVLHDTEAAAGYAVPEFITSPMHHRIIDTANQPHDGLLFDAGAPHSFLLLESAANEDGAPLLTARIMAATPNEGENAGVSVEELFTFTRTLGELAADR